MSRPCGLQKTGGRTAGTPNKRTLFLADMFEELGHDIPTKIIELLPNLAPEKQIDVYMELLQYLYPKRKSIELTAIPNQPSEIQKMSTEELEAELDRLIKIREIGRDENGKAI